MFSFEDISKLIKALKSVFPTRDELDQKFKNQEDNFSQLQTSVDKIARNMDVFNTELVIQRSRIDKLSNKT